MYVLYWIHKYGNPICYATYRDESLNKTIHDIVQRAPAQTISKSVNRSVQLIGYFRFEELMYGYTKNFG